MKGNLKSITWFYLLMLVLMQAMPSMAATIDSNSQTALNSVGNQLSNYYFNEYKNSWGWNWLKTTSVNFNAFTSGTPQWNISTFQPLTLKDNLNNFLFAQGQYGTDNNTINFGVGYRSMNAEHSSMYGLNLFYDWQPKVTGINGYTPTGNSLMRAGIGLEYFAGSLEFRANGYYGVSSDVQVANVVASDQLTAIQTWQHVAPGADLSLGTDFGFWNAAWLKFTASANYYARTQGGTINGCQGSPLYGNINASMQLTPQLAINGSTSFGNGAASTSQVGVAFNLLAPPQPAMFMADKEINKLSTTDISYKMLQPVQRNNVITVEQYQKTVAGPNTSYPAIVRNSAGLLQPGVISTLSYTMPTGVVAPTGTASATSDDNGRLQFNIPSDATPQQISARIGATTSTVIVSSQVNPQIALPTSGSIILTGENARSLTNGTAQLYNENTNQAVDFNYDLEQPSYYRFVDGAIRIDGLTPGQTYTIRIMHDNITDIISSLVASSAPDDASPTDVNSNINLINNGSTGSVGVQVFYQDGVVPYPGSSVKLSTKGVLGNSYMIATTNAQGTAAFTSIPYGSYRITFEDEENILFPTDDKYFDVTVSADHPQVNINANTNYFAPIMDGSVQVNTIAYSDNAAVLASGTILKLVNADNGAIYTSNYSGGSARFSNLPEGATFSLWAILSNGAADVVDSEGTALSITIPDNNTVAVAGFISGTSAEVGTVALTMTADGATVNSGTEYGLLDETGNVVVSRICGSSNAVVIGNVAPGNYRPYLGNTEIAGKSIRGVKYVGNAIVVTADNTTTAQLAALSSTFAITTKQADSTTAPNEPVIVTLGSTNTVVSQVTTDATGTAHAYLWQACVGTVPLYSFMATINAKTVVMSNLSPSISITDIHLQPDANASSGNGTIVGVISIGDVTNYSGSQININPQPATSPALTMNSNGTFVLGNVPAGSYTLTCSVPGYQDNTLSDIVSVQPSSTANIGVISNNFVREPVAVAGRITLASGAPASNTPVAIARGSSRPIVTNTDAQGYYSFLADQGLTTGMYTFSVLIGANDGTNYTTKTKYFTLDYGMNTVNIQVN